MTGVPDTSADANCRPRRTPPLTPDAASPDTSRALQHAAASGAGEQPRVARR